MSGQDFDGDVATEARVAGTIDFAHASRADGGEYFVGAELDTRCEGHGRGEL